MLPIFNIHICNQLIRVVGWKFRSCDLNGDWIIVIFFFCEIVQLVTYFLVALELLAPLLGVIG